MNRKKTQTQTYVKVPRNFVFMSLILLVISLLPVMVLAQNQITIKSKVIDAKGEAVIGASVFVEGTKTGTVTDIDGNFTIKANPGSNISISYIGYVTQKFKASAVPARVVLEEEQTKLDEVVVVGYGQVKRANLTGAVTNIAMKEVADIPAPNLASVLSGTMPGVHVDEPTGNPIGVAKVNVRINGTFSTTNEPLYVIDGFIRDVYAFNMLDPSEIESISVLKDASAAVYGVRGANGVVLVATKKGKTGKPRINYSGSYGTNQGIEMPQMMSAYQQGVALNDLWAQETAYKHSTTTYNYFTDAELEKMKSLDYNWLDMGWHNSSNTRHTLNVSGGSEDVQYFVGGSYMYANGNFSNLSSNRYGVRFGVDAKITKQLKGNFSMDYSQRDTQQPLNSLDTEYDRMYGTFSELVRTPRYIPPYINGLAVNYDTKSTGTHPLEMFNSGSYRKNNSSDVSIGMALEYNIEKIKGLKVKLSGNYSKSSSYGKQLAVPYYLYTFVKDSEYTHLLTDQQLPITDSNYRRKVTNGEKIYESATFGYSYQLNPELSYNATFGKHNISALLVYEQAQSGGNGLSESRQTLVIPNYEVMDGYSTAAQTTASNIDNLSRRQSGILRLSYDYAGKYFFEGTLRDDGSTKFAPEYRWGMFYSMSLGWRISDEKFFDDLRKTIDNMKIRLSAGRLGSDKATANQWRTSYVTNGTSYLGGGATVSNLKPQNGGLVYYISTWEKTNSYNVGLDMRILNQINFAFDGFFKHTFDILDSPQSVFPQSGGVTGTIPKINYGVQDAWGGELEIGWDKKLSKDWSVKVKTNLAYAMNIVRKKYQNPGVAGTWADENGKVSGGEVGYKSLGLARTQQDIDDYIAYLQDNYKAYHGTTGTVKAFNVSQEDMKPGMLMLADVGSAAYQDENGKWHDGAPDGIVDENDQRIISKYSFAPYNYGFTLGFKWKDLAVDAMFTGAFGNDVIFEKGFWTNASGGGRTGDFLSQYSNQLSEWSGNYWTESNTNAKYPRLDDYSLRGYRSTFWMRNGHELHLKTINVSYSLPAKFAKTVGLETCRVFFQGSNLWTIINPYPYKDASVGFWSDYPMIRTLNLGLNISL